MFLIFNNITPYYGDEIFLICKFKWYSNLVIYLNRALAKQIFKTDIINDVEVLNVLSHYPAYKGFYKS